MLGNLRKLDTPKVLNETNSQIQELQRLLSVEKEKNERLMEENIALREISSQFNHLKQIFDELFENFSKAKSNFEDAAEGILKLSLVI